ncbi:hypothetical protein ACL02T_20810 [Pseudonocardia sp. RS010]|uniref:hypothetical protein n=1 Tax=Pseudonocardia sp. RS010 TaxID=3385979 RepID=UPI0039A2D3A7
MTRAGGAVGFPPAAPEADIRDLAEATAAEVRAGTLDMLVLHLPTPPGSAPHPSAPPGSAPPGSARHPVGIGGGELVGTVFLQPGRGPVVAHRAIVLRLMVRPDL